MKKKRGKGWHKSEILNFLLLTSIKKSPFWTWSSLTPFFLICWHLWYLQICKVLSFIVHWDGCTTLSTFHIFCSPRGIHLRKLIFIWLQSQSKIRQCWCCLHDSVINIDNKTEDFISHSTAFHQQESSSIIKLHWFIKEIKFTSHRSIDHGLFGPCLMYPWESSHKDIS